jgi:2-keto-4-pentenoate hydratase/2-oxohepta-3-ene-1,7-dioic acid hydratase in catechol pathway
MKIICIGRNYAEHARELNNPVPAKPVVFMKPPTALLVNDKPFYYPEFTSDLHHECEVVLRLCKNGRHVQPEFADTYFDAISLGIDFTARDVQDECKKKGHPWEIAKAFDNSAVVGKFLPRDQVNTADIEFQLLKNGSTVQHGHTRDMIFSFGEIIAYVSQFFKLQTGDYIFTGTPAGVGPIQIGDTLEGVLFTKVAEQKLFECRIK